jgi:DNA topoisomerase-2
MSANTVLSTTTKAKVAGAKPKPISASDAALSQQYQRKTDKQHILDNPDTYIGSIENVDAHMWVWNDEATMDSDLVSVVSTATSEDDTASKASGGANATVGATKLKCCTLRTIEYIPGLYKLFDEGIVNCRDHVIRMMQQHDAAGTSQEAADKRCVTYIKITIGEDGVIVFENDGNGIDVAKHPEYDIWIPELVFGHLRTSTNYNKDEKRIVGGKNGFGFKLVLIWSEWGKVETVDHVRGLKYTQEFKHNLDEIGEPTIVKVAKTTKPFTRVTFKPDYARFGLDANLTHDMMCLLKKRVYDIAAVTDHSSKKIKITLNGAPVPIRNFQQYVDLYIGGKGEAKRAYECGPGGERWEYAVALTPTHQFEQVSFVNGICTFKGGKHVDYILGQITRKLSAYIEKKKKVVVNPNTIKEQLFLFLRADIENPAFDSQTKDYMNTPSAKFGSTCTVSDAFIEKIAKMGVMDAACQLSDLKERSAAAKRTDGTKTRTIRGIANFIDANYAGTATQSKECILILCEGLSAMSGVVSGLSSEDRNRYGIYPLKGKLLNVRGEGIKKISDNKEITDLKRILGLETDRVYATQEDVWQHLRYGKVMFLTDSDVDGSHIKGLCVNLFQSEWTSLFQQSGFLSFMNTPILRAKRGQQTRVFYHEGEYQTWKQEMETSGSGSGTGTAGWTMKYFKGLGTSTAVEFKEYFANKKVVDFAYQGPSSDQILDKIFNKKRADERKRWLEDYDKAAYLDTTLPTVSYEAFIDRELRHFSVYDCERSIPNLVDGLKTSLRKILFSAFKRKLTSEVKVAQFSGYVSEHSAYHHGEQSLNGAIVGMAQNFVGSNNIHLLMPNGQYGSRLQGGDDSASERYIYTLLNPLTRYLFRESDDAVLTYRKDDGQPIEPEYYVPILPMVLVNGVSGIGTGFSSSIPPFHPMKLVEYVRARLSSESSVPCEPLVPYYENFRGTVMPVPGESHKYLIKGVYRVLETMADTIQICELPVGTWTMPYIAVLESLADGGMDKKGKKIAPVIKDFVSNSTEKLVDIRVTFPKGKLTELEALVDSDTGINGIEKLLKLTTTVSTTNMHLFDAECKLNKYATVESIIDAFVPVRLGYYDVRKKQQLRAMEQTLKKLSNKAKYIQLVLAGTIDLRRKSLAQIDDLLTGHGLERWTANLKEDNNIGEEDGAVATSALGTYEYLVRMPMVSVSSEHVDKLLKEKAELESRWANLNGTTVEQLWLTELAEFEHEYDGFVKKWATEYSSTGAATKGGGAAKKTRVVVKK